MAPAVDKRQRAESLHCQALSAARQRSSGGSIIASLDATVVLSDALGTACPSGCPT